MLSALFALVISEIGSLFMPRLAWTAVFLFVLSWVAEVTDASHHAQPLIEMGSWLAPISVSQLAKITNLSNHAQLIFLRNLHIILFGFH
jgi:hypothetical protein